MSSEVMISAHNLTKVYKLYERPAHRLIQELKFWGKRSAQEFTAVNDVTFDVYSGQTVGIIGRNGSGKSTLLQLMCGIRKPTRGEVRCRGRVSALLELGAGFHHDLTGRENIYLQGAIMGLNQNAIRSRLDDIIEFSEIEPAFIDQRVANYSSGMYLRLAFSLAVAVNPQVLIVDEALAVGDVGFQEKCIDKIRSLKRAGVTILLVSHDTTLMKHFGDKVLYMEHGRIKMTGEPEPVVNAFIRDCGITDSGGMTI